MINTVTISRKILLPLILICITFSQFGIDVYVPSFPAMMESFHTTQIALSITTYLIGLAVSQLIFGPISDRFGRRKPLLIGLLGFLLTTIFCILTNSFLLFITLRFLQGLFIGSSATISRAMIRDLCEGKELNKAFSYVAITWSLTPLIAPVIGSYIQHNLGWRFNFVFLFVYVSAISLLLLLLLPETLAKEKFAQSNIKNLIKNYITLLTSSVFMSSTICLFFAFGIFISYSAFAPIILQKQLHIPVIHYGWLTLFVSSGYLGGCFWNNRLLVRHSDKYIMIIGAIISTIASICLLILSILSLITVWSFILSTWVVFVAIGLIYPNGMARSMQPFPQIAGMASALFGTFAMLGGALASNIVAYLPIDSDLPFMILFSLQVLVTTFILCFFVLKLGRKQSSIQV